MVESLQSSLAIPGQEFPYTTYYGEFEKALLCLVDQPPPWKTSYMPVNNSLLASRQNTTVLIRDASWTNRFVPVVKATLRQFVPRFLVWF